MTTTPHIASITLDGITIKTRTPEVEYERNVAIADLIEWNHFAIKDGDGKHAEGPYDITLSTAENRVTFTANSSTLESPLVVSLTLAPFRSVIKDYFLICESYFDAVKSGNMPRIEAIDMSRRGLHNEGAELISELMAEKVTMDSETARRLFTLICALHLK